MVLMVLINSDQFRSDLTCWTNSLWKSIVFFERSGGGVVGGPVAMGGGATGAGGAAGSSG